MPRPDWKSQINPELRGIYAQLPKLTFGPLTVRLLRMAERLMPTPAVPEGVSFREIVHEGRPIRLFEPRNGPTTPAAMLWIHGGGRLIGTPAMMDRHCIRMVQHLGILSASVGYRRAPEHRYPAALDDCVAGFRWLEANAGELGIDPERIVVGGESAGGGLAAELTHRVHDAMYEEGDVQPAGQVLVYPMLDDATATRRELTVLRHPVWNNRSNHYGWSSYLGEPLGEPDGDPYAAAARRSDLSGLPPTWLTVGDLDLFLDECLSYVERLHDAGVPVTLDRMEGGFHGFFALGTDEPPIVAMWESLERFVRACVER